MTQLDSSFKIVPELESLARCCASHGDWPTLAEHLLRDFPEIHIAEIVHQLRTARDLVEAVGMDEVDSLDTAELIVRQQLSIMAGPVAEVAHLDPKRHHGGA